jgi:hypothetical protein
MKKLSCAHFERPPRHARQPVLRGETRHPARSGLSMKMEERARSLLIGPYTRLAAGQQAASSIYGPKMYSFQVVVMTKGICRAIDQAARGSMICYGQNRRRKNPRQSLRSAVSSGECVNPSTQTRSMTVIDYKGYRIEVRPLGKGWRASIFSPGSTSPWPNSPVNLEKSSMEQIVAEAKRIIEVRLGPRVL